MKFFSLFGKKQQQAETLAENAHACDGSGENMRANSQAESVGNPQFERRKVARATELKIDAIESAMSLQLDGSSRTHGNSDSLGAVSAKERAGNELHAFGNTLQQLEAPTQILFDNRFAGAAFALAPTLPTPLIEEAAILFANDQQALAELLLQNAMLDATPPAEAEHACLLLFDLYQFGGQRQKFDSLSADYIGRFENAPPAWRDPAQQVRSAAPALDQPDHFPMPELVTGDIRQLLEAISAFSAGRTTVAIDCSRLNRIDFDASRQLLAGLVPLARNGKILEFHAVNHPVAALLNVMGLNEIASIIARKG